MKIGILTFHNAYNYGAVLQAYALQTFLEKNGNEVEIIDYRNEEVERSYQLFRLRSIPRKSAKRFFYYWIVNIYRFIKYKEFKNNVLSLLKISRPTHSFNDVSIIDKDVIVIGSDQLWNKDITRIYDPFYWGEFSKSFNGSIISYAVCMNAETLSIEELDFIKKHLNNFSCISVREKDLANTLCKLTSKYVHISLDPTLMVESSFWFDLVKKNKDVLELQHYVLVFAILERDIVIEKAKEFARIHNLRLLIMNPIADISPFNDYYQPTSPLAFLSVIANASYVITSSFHGLAFSIIYHRVFYVMGNSGKNERMKSLLSSIGLSDRFISSSTSVENIIPINYNEVDKKLNKMRDDSRSYLINSICN